MLLVDQRQLLDSMGLQNFLGMLEVDAGLRGDHFGGHHLAHAAVQALFETQVAIGEYPDQAAVG